MYTYNCAFTVSVILPVVHVHIHAWCAYNVWCMHVHNVSLCIWHIPHTHTYTCNIKVNKVGLKIRTAIVTEIYRKALSISSTTLSQFSTGQVSHTCMEVVSCAWRSAPYRAVECHELLVMGGGRGHCRMNYLIAVQELAIWIRLLNGVTLFWGTIGTCWCLPPPIAFLFEFLLLNLNLATNNSITQQWPWGPLIRKKKWMYMAQ